MTRCAVCGATFGDMTELAHHDCRPTYEEVKRVRTAILKRAEAAHQAERLERYQDDYGGR